MKTLFLYDKYLELEFQNTLPEDGKSLQILNEIRALIAKETAYVKSDVLDTPMDKVKTKKRPYTSLIDFISPLTLKTQLQLFFLDQYYFS